jgi:hypothetical protein
MSKLSFASLLLLTGLLLSSCIRFTFTGASIPADAKTFSVTYFENNASLVNPNLSRTLTEKLQDKIVGQTSLVMVNSGGDLAFQGEITGYTLQPVAIQGDATAQLTQLTVTINVRYYNKSDESKNFEARFTRYQQYSSSLNLAAIEDGLIETICEELVDDIFNKALVNW